MEMRQFTVSVPVELAAYAERLVESGQAASVSAVVSQALTDQLERERRARQWWLDKKAEVEADPETMARVDRIVAHVDAQARRFEAERRRP